jgi:hypothetical protein
MSKPIKTSRLRACLGVLVTAGALLVAMPAIASAATYTPNNNASGTNSLSADVAAIDAAGGSNTIDLPTGNISPSSTLVFSSTGTTTIIGSTAAQSTLTATNVTPFPSDFIDINDGNVTFEHVSINNGGDSTTGIPSINVGQNGATAAGPTLTIEDSNVNGSSGPALELENGTATFEDSTINDGAYDASIIDQNVVNLDNSTLAYNSGGVDDTGGTRNLTNSILTNNAGGNCLAPISAFRTLKLRARPLGSLELAFADAGLRTRSRHACDCKVRVLTGCAGTAIAFGNALAQCHGSDLLSRRLLFTHKPAVPFLTSPTFRKVFTGRAQA